MQRAARPLRIGLIGCGFMGRAHSNAYKRVADFFDVDYRPVLDTICARDRTSAESFARQWGFASVETDWRAVVEGSGVDVIDIASPNDTHAEIAIAAAQAGKMVVCEKPLARSLAEAERMTAAVERSGVRNMVWYNYRRVPAITFAKQLIEEGKLGRIFITAPNFCRTGPSHPIFRRAASLSGDWMRMLPEAESRATCWPIASIRLNG